MASVHYSKQLKSQVRSDISIKNAHDHINKFINKGTELAKPLQHELSGVMWKHCGVIKDKNLLESGLKKIIDIKNIIKDVDVRIDYQSCDDLVQVFDLEASVISAEATILSALTRQESRGSHQRSDYKELNTDEKCNYHVKLNKQTLDLEISKRYISPLRKDLQNIIDQTSKVINLTNKLLE